MDSAHCGFFVLPEPVTLPPQTPYGVRLHLTNPLVGQLLELESVLSHDDHAAAYAELAVFLYGRRRERLP